MTRSNAFVKLTVYLRSRASGKFVMSEAQIAKELLLNKADVAALLNDKRLKSCHIDDVAEYIIREDSNNGKN